MLPGDRLLSCLFSVVSIALITIEGATVWSGLAVTVALGLLIIGPLEKRLFREP